MTAIVQRVLQAKVIVDDQIVGQINQGMLVLAAIEKDDTETDVDWMTSKLTTLRIFRSGAKHFDQDVKQINGSILLVSNFTVAAETRKGRRPSLENAAPPENGRALFDQFIQKVRATGVPTATGQFAADMIVTLTNDGPVTFIVKSRA